MGPQGGGPGPLVPAWLTEQTDIAPFCPYVLHILYVQEVVTLQKKIFNIFASENEVYTIY